MRRLRGLACAAIVLGVVSLAAMGVGHLAFSDIAHGEGDLARERLILQVSALLVLTCTGLAPVTLAGFLGLSRRQG